MRPATIAAMSNAHSHAFQRDLRGQGWGWGETRWNALAYVLPLGYAGVAYGLVWLSGLGGVDLARAGPPTVVVDRLRDEPLVHDLQRHGGQATPGPRRSGSVQHSCRGSIAPFPPDGGLGRTLGARGRTSR